MIAPGDEFAGGIEATLEEMKPGGAIEIVVKIVLAGPEEFDGDAYMLSNSTGFQHVVIGAPTAKSAAAALQGDDDLVVGNIGNFGDGRAASFRCLARNFFRALLACHQVSATIATPQCKPSRSELPSTEKASRTPGRALISSKLALMNLPA